MREAASEERINAMVEAIHRLWRGENIRDAKGVYFRRGAGGVDMRFRRARALAGGVSAPPKSLMIVDSRPANVAAPSAPPASGYKRYWVTLGTCNAVPIKDFTDHEDIDATTKFYLKVKVRTTGGLVVEECEVVTYAEAASPPDPVWQQDGTRPQYWYAYLGQVTKVDQGGGSYTYAITNDGEGSFILFETALGLDSVINNPASSSPCMDIMRDLVFVRRS